MNLLGLRLLIVRKRLSIWLWEHTPVSCFVCMKIVLRKDADYSQHRMGGPVALCHHCYDLFYRPFSGSKR